MVNGKLITRKRNHPIFIVKQGIGIISLWIKCPIVTYLGKYYSLRRCLSGKAKKPVINDYRL
jgi:hypothetical protein